MSERRKDMGIGRLLFAAGLLALGTAMPALAQDVVRHRTPGSNFPIAMAVEVPAGATTVMVSGMVPAVADSAAPRNSLASFGDTRAQTASVLSRIEAGLKSIGLSLFMAAYSGHFGTAAQPNVPARSVMQVAGLVNPGWLVEIEVTAVRH
jgi:enamine deaminase RidA (YjgF/YER057c/UK114 family)